MPKKPRVSAEMTEAQAEAEWGNEIIRTIASKLYLAQSPVNRLLSKLLEKDIEEVKKMPLKDTMKTIAEMIGIDSVKDFSNKPDLWVDRHFRHSHEQVRYDSI